ncbi:hypothetical protein [Sphingomonas prati]|uniref:Peptidase n=1 Tax=Sphingomonas prati TaxID=1843237 RepID=A0A7W9BSH3_9SPHN|nr:hypothetical protein [Sphingomonas prati]MBB5729285.1 hypothetical protein [Sphingomonas prati]GGE78636.1 hypothetical protein GCM10011404_09170 [Sphingomonas prati]
MNVAFDRVLDTPPPAFPIVPDVFAGPPPGALIGADTAGWVVDHAINNSFTLTNRLLKARLPVQWMTAPTAVAGRTLAPGALWIPASPKARAIVTAAVTELGLDASGMTARPTGDAIAVKPVRIGLVDLYGGSMASGWTRWILEQYEFPYTRVFPQELDKGGLNRRYDALVFQSDVLGREGRPDRPQPAAATLPAQYRPWLGRITEEKTLPQVAAFARAGGTVITIGDASRLGPALGVPVTNALAPGGKKLSTTQFYVPGSILTAMVDPTVPLAYGMPARINLFYNNNPVFAGAGDTSAARRVSWFAQDDPLVSGWAWGQRALNGTAGVVDASVGKGKILLMGPEVTQHGQPYATFKFLFNGLLYGSGTTKP